MADIRIKRFQAPRLWTLIQRLEYYTDKSSGDESCWPWTGNRFRFGHGVLKWERRSMLAHRLTWVVMRGEIPAGLCVLHRCDNPPCCNPRHLFLGTKGDNNADRASKKRGINLRGAAHPRPQARLSPIDIKTIRALGLPQSELASLFDVSQSMISKILSGKAWKHV